MYHRQLPHLCLILILALVASAAPRAEEEFLLPEQAFPAVAVAEGPRYPAPELDGGGGLTIFTAISSNFGSLTEGIRTGEPELPAGEKRHDEFFGEVEILRGPVAVRLPIERATAREGTRLSLEVSSQGCADAGLCYPPHRQTLAIDIPPWPAPTRREARPSPWLKQQIRADPVPWPRRSE